MYKYQDRDITNSRPNSYNQVDSNTYYNQINHNPINNKNIEKIQIVQSKIVQNHNSSSTFTGYAPLNKYSSLQVSEQYDAEIKQNQNQLNLYNKRQPDNQMIKTRNKISVISQNHSVASLNSRNNDSSLNKRSGSNSRGGIKVTSRNSSFQKKSSTSIQKQNQQKDRNLGTNAPSCGLNCTNRSPFVQAQKNNEVVIIPNLGSLDTLKSQTTYTQMLSQRVKNKNKIQYSNIGQNFYQNVSQVTHIEPSPTNIKHNLSQRQTNREPLYYIQNRNKTEDIYKNIRQMMEKQLLVARKLYQKKCQDEIQNLNIFYKSQIQTLQNVLGENQTIIETQNRKIEKLQEKIYKKDAKLQKYQQRFQSIRKFIQTSTKFTYDRLQQVQKKFQILMTDYQSITNFSSHQNSFNNKFDYAKDIYCVLIAQTITKYRSIQHEIKEQIKSMLKKYEYFEQKVYEMDLLKHLGKQNQIQNYKLIQKIQSMKEHLIIIESNAKGGNHMLNSPKVGSNRNTDYQQSSPMNNMQTYPDYNNRINQLVLNQIQQIRQKIQRLQKQKSQISSKNNQLIKQINRLNQVNESTKIKIQKSIEINQRSNQATENFVKRISEIQDDNYRKGLEIERLVRVIDQYEVKIESYNKTIDSLESQNKKTHKELYQKTNLLQTLQHNSNQSVSIYTEQIQKLTQIIEQKQYRSNQLINQLQNQIKQKELLINQKRLLESSHQNQYEERIEELNNQKIQLNEALEMTQKIFDQQINKFKQTISKLQEENQNLIQQVDWYKQQVNTLRQQVQYLREDRNNYLSNSASSKNSDNGVNKKITLSKSPKKQVCQTVTMGWFKKNVQKTADNKQTYNDFYSSPTSKNIAIDQVKQFSNQKNSTSNKFYTNSPQYQNEEFFYHNQTTKQSFHSTSIMQSHPNIGQPYQNSFKNMQNKQDRINQSSLNSIKSKQIQFTMPKQKQYSTSRDYNKKQRSSDYLQRDENSNIISLSTQKKLLSLKQILQQQNYSLPVQCILDKQNQLQIYQTGIYIVDQRYRTFILSQNQANLAQMNRIITLLNEKNNEPQEDQDQQLNYIY